MSKSELRLSEFNVERSNFDFEIQTKFWYNKMWSEHDETFFDVFREYSGTPVKERNFIASVW